MASSCALLRLGSPEPTTTTLLTSAVVRTVVVNVLSGPKRVKALDAVTSLFVDAGSRPVSPLFRHTTVFDALSTTAPLNRVPKRAVVARLVSAERIRRSAGVKAYPAVANDVAAGADGRAGASAPACDSWADPMSRAPATAAPRRERTAGIVCGMRFGPLVVVS